MEKVIHRSKSRGNYDHGWLNTNHSFSFGNYYNPEKMGFGLLRVLNDDFVIGGQGFPRHPHQNMEIISIPLEGELEHKDSMGNTFIIKKNDVQIMSAGTGVMHSEYNKSSENTVNFLQIWIYPKEKDITPNYDQKTFDPNERINKWQKVVSENDPNAVLINQDAELAMSDLKAGNNLDLRIEHEGNGIYLFLISGKIEIEGDTLERRDSIGISDFDTTKIMALEDSEILTIEVPLNIK
jgi:redox-sensitive bicupin YhaK (pirin superfamily)